MSYYLKSLILLIIILHPAYSQAQVTRFVYEYRYIPDSLNQNQVKSELMYLDVTSEKSEFYSKEKFEIDSTIYAAELKQIFSMPPPKNFIQYVITKQKNDSLSVMHLPLISEKFAVSLNTKFSWKILNEFIPILGKKSQKATTTFGGRKWNAWFRNDLPFNDGPYKFRGLPGLITKIEDVEHQHMFELVAIKKLENYKLQEKIFEKKFQSEIKISEKEYSKILKNYRNDPVAHLVGQIPDQKDSEGNFRSSQEILKTIKNHEMKKIKDNNNTIELEKIKN